MHIANGDDHIFSKVLAITAGMISRQKEGFTILLDIRWISQSSVADSSM